MHLVLVRHGSTIENEAGITQGHTPGHLSTKGIIQATRVAERLANKHFDYIYTSDLARAVDTAHLIAAFHEHTPFQKTKELRERCWGALENKRVKDQEYYALPREQWPLPKGAESEEEIVHRIKNFLTLLLEKHNKDTVLLVAHDETIKALLALCTNQAYGQLRTEFKIKATSITTITIETLGKGTIKTFNDTSHL